MMRLTIPLPDFNNLQNNIPDWAMGYLFGKGVDYIRKNYKVIFRPKNFRKNFGWFQICSLAICFIISFKLEQLFERLHAKKLANRIEKNSTRILKRGFKILTKIDPDLAYLIYQKFEALVRAIQIGRITGVYNYDDVFKL